MSQRQEYQKPLVLQIDLNQATYQSFLNCINSFQGLETESEMRSIQGAAVSNMSSKVSMERFIYNLGVLAGLTAQDGYDPSMDMPKAFTYWKDLVAYLKGSGFFKRVSDTAHL